MRRQLDGMCDEREGGCGDDGGGPGRLREAKQLRHRRERSYQRQAQSEFEDRRAPRSAGTGRQVGDEEQQAPGDRAHDSAFPVPSEDDMPDRMSRQLGERLAQSHGVPARLEAIIRANAMMVHEGATPQADGKRLASAT